MQRSPKRSPKGKMIGQSGLASVAPHVPGRTTSRPLALSLAALSVTLAILANGRNARANNYTITVDASKQTAGNPRFWTASVGTGTAALTLRSDLQTQYKLGNREIGFQRVRGH